MTVMEEQKLGEQKPSTWSAKKKWTVRGILLAVLVLAGEEVLRQAVNPWEWYRHLQSAGSLAPATVDTSGKRIRCLYRVTSEAGSGRYHILQAKDRFKLSLIEVDLVNLGNKPAEHAYVNAELGEEATDVHIYGLPDAEFLDEDGSYRKLGSEWRKVGKLVRVRYDGLPPGLTAKLSIGLARVKEKSLTPPEVGGGDDAGFAKGEVVK